MENEEFSTQLKKTPPTSKRKLPDWLKTPLPSGEEYYRLRGLVKSAKLHTVCESASCPNIGTCWSAGNLTIMILGDICTRACGFCDVATGKPLALREDEPQAVAEMLSALNLRYVVVTSVDRDDLKDGGAGHWVKTIEAIRSRCPGLKLETLIPDFRGERDLLAPIYEARPNVLSHNLETVASLQARVRPQCRYEWSLKTLEIARRDFNLITKSGLMLGIGESKEEVIQAIKDLAGVGCQMLTLGQYLKPSVKHLEVAEFIHPDVFEEYREIGKTLGIPHVEAGPLVRSSYLAENQAQGLEL